MSKIIKSTLCMILAFSMVLEFPIQVFANGNDPIDFRLDNDAYYEEMPGALYYHEENDEYVINIGLYDQVIDCSFILKNNPDLMYTGIFDKKCYFGDQNATREEVIQGTVSAVLRDPYKAGMIEYPLSGFATIDVSQQNSVQSLATDRPIILNTLYAQGEPSVSGQVYYSTKHITYQYVNYTVDLYKSVTYTFSKLKDWAVLIGTSISAAATLTSLGGYGAIMAIILFAVNANGVYEAIQNVTGSTYTVYETQNKHAKVFGYESYTSVYRKIWRTGINANGYVGLELKSTYISPDYDNDSLIAQQSVEDLVNSGM